MRSGPRAGRLPRAALAVAGAVLATSGCATALGQQAATGDQKNYIAGQGSFRFISPADRGEPVDLSGTTADGSRVDVARWRGDIVVVNVWFASCAPCRTEAPALAEVARSAGPHVHFVGIDTDDDADAVNAFDAQYSVPYPSILDHRSGAAVLALRGTLPPQATPSTIILDARGRPAARVVGPSERSVLTGLIQDVRAGTLHPHVSYSPSASPSAPAQPAPTTSGGGA